MNIHISEWIMCVQKTNNEKNVINLVQKISRCLQSWLNSKWKQEIASCKNLPLQWQN